GHTHAASETARAGVEHAPGHARSRERVTPLAADAYEAYFTMDQEMYDDLGYVRSLLGPRAGSSRIGKIFRRALKALIPQIERRRFAATSRPRKGRKHAASGTRYVPNQVKRAVWKRDRGQCTFVSDSGHRCEARTGIEFDHVREVARGGEATVE